MELVRVRFSTSADRGTIETVEGGKTVRSYLQDKNARMETKFYSSGREITGELDKTLGELFNELGSGDVLNIHEVAKTTGA